MADNNRDYQFYKRLRKFVRRPSVRRNYAERPANRMDSRMFGAFARVATNQYMHSIAGSTERLARARDYELMDISSSIINTALNVWADDCTTYNEDGKILKIACSNEKIKTILDELFYERLSIDHNLWHWIRNLCKYGDFFLLLDVLEEKGITSFMPLPTVEVDREEAYDGDINSVRYKWNTASGVTFENWQVVHFRMISDDTFLPYGKSNLEAGRRVWKQLNLIEDAMLVYRIQRAPERRIFKIDVGNMPANDIPAFMQKAKDILKRQPLVDSTGNIDLRYNVHSQEEDYFLPVRGGQSATDITSLPGAQNLGDIDDVRYVQNNLIAALGIPRAYLTFEEQLSSKTTLSQEDVRFARTIQRIQKFALKGLMQIAQTHLFALGIEEAEDLQSFKLFLTNPSTVQEQMKIEFLNTKLTTYQTAVQSVGVDREWAQKKILHLTNKERERIELGLKRDAKLNAELQVVAQKVMQANQPQQPGGEGGGEQPEVPPPGQPPLDQIPGGQAQPGGDQHPGPQSGKTGSSFKNNPDNPMSMTQPSKKDVSEEEELEEEPKVADLFDPKDKEDREIISIAKKYDWLQNALEERAKVSQDMQHIFIKLGKALNHGKDQA